MLIKRTFTGKIRKNIGTAKCLQKKFGAQLCNPSSTLWSWVFARWNGNIAPATRGTRIWTLFHFKNPQRSLSGPLVYMGLRMLDFYCVLWKRLHIFPQIKANIGASQPALHGSRQGLSVGHFNNIYRKVYIWAKTDMGSLQENRNFERWIHNETNFRGGARV